MADSKSWVEVMDCRVNGPEGQGSIDVYVFVRCPDFFPAQGWYWKECPEDTPLVDFLRDNFAGHLEWERRSHPEWGNE